jgi:ribonuclease BN (tRNA processing enzyme)
VVAELTVLGSGGWMPSDRRETSCHALRTGSSLLLLDAGTGLRRLVTDPALLGGVTRIDILLSHFHADHTVGLTYLPAIPEPPEIVVWAPGDELYGVDARTILDAFTGPPFQPTPLTSFVSAIMDVPEDTFEVDAGTVRVRVQAGHSHPSLAYRIGDLFTYCTDTPYDPGNAELAAGSGVLLHEAWHAAPPAHQYHSSATDAAAIARDAGVRDLVLTHLDPRGDETALLTAARSVFPATRLAQDNASLRVPG